MTEKQSNLSEDHIEENQNAKFDNNEYSSGKKKTYRGKGSYINQEHGFCSEKVYPISESSVRLLKTNNRISSMLLSASTAFLGVAFTTFINIFTTIHKEINIFITIFLFLLSITLSIFYLVIKKPIADEWSRIEKTTKFND